VDDEGDIKISALDQLLMVIPPSSMNLIPEKKYRSAMTDLSMGYVHNFPNAFKIVTYMKYMLHECSAGGLNLKEPIILN
jgi:5'-3' exonuclease